MVLPSISPSLSESCFIAPRFSNSNHEQSHDSRSTHFNEWSVICNASLGDSDIRKVNKTPWIDHQASIANNVWAFAKNHLGVVGDEYDEVYVDAIKVMESRDQDAKEKRENNSNNLQWR